MDAQPAHANDTSVNSPAPVVPMLRAVLLCDIVESTALVERLGDARAAGLMQHHDQLLRQALSICRGQLIDRAVADIPFEPAIRLEQQFRAGLHHA